MTKKSDPRLSELASRITEVTERLGSIDGAAKKVGVSASSLGRMRRGENEPSVFLVAKVAEATNVSIEWLVGLSGKPGVPTRQAEPSGLKVQKLDVRAAAGGGAINNVLKTEETREFPLWMLQKLTKTARGKQARLSLIRAAGDSMEPLIRSGALLLVDETARDPRSSPKPENLWDHTDVYIFLQGDELRLKRLHVDRRGATIALSENPAHRPEILHKQDFKVLGRVIWWDNRL